MPRPRLNPKAQFETVNLKPARGSKCGFPVLRELTRADWLRILNFPESRIPTVLILRGTRNLRSQHEAALPYFSNVLEVGAPNGIFEDVFIGELRGRTVGFACVYGACMASEIVHVFGALGTRAVIQTGNCGALADDMAAGDLFLADRAYCGEGAAQYYRGQDRWATASASLLRYGALAKLDRRGAIYTTAALLAEGMDDLERWFQQGFTAVDMETATTYAVAEHFGMERIAVLYAFDNPRRREHLLQSDAEKDARRTAANAKMRELTFDLAEEMSAK
jgi:purine-nucleoside phosphorylase